MVHHTYPNVTYNYIRNNGGDSETRAGRSRRGGGAAINGDDDVEFDEDRNRDIPGYSNHTREDEIVFSNNRFESNYAVAGLSLSSNEYNGTIDLSKHACAHHHMRVQGGVMENSQQHYPLSHSVQ